MKVLALCLVLGLAGCTAVKEVGTAIDIATTSVANPVTKQRLAQIELSANIPLTALVSYRRACLKGAADSHCRANIAALQVYTRQLPPYIAQLRAFVKNDDQINAVVVYDQINTTLTNIRNTAASVGVNLGA